MPWLNLNAMDEADLRAIHRFTRALGAPGGPAPAWVPPDEEPQPPYALFPSPPAGDRAGPARNGVPKPAEIAVAWGCSADPGGPGAAPPAHATGAPRLKRRRRGPT